MDHEALDALLSSSSSVASVVVGEIEAALAEAISATVNTVYLSWMTAQKQLRQHPDLKLWEYQLLPTILHRGIVVKDSPKTLIVTHYDIEPPNRLYKAAIKATDVGHEIYLISFHRARLKSLLNIRNRGKIIRRFQY